MAEGRGSTAVAKKFHVGAVNRRLHVHGAVKQAKLQFQIILICTEAVTDNKRGEMGFYDNAVEVTRRTLVLFFVVDCSGSMTGSKIGTVNAAIEELVPEIKDISETNADAKIKIATLAFSDKAYWLEEAPVPIDDFRWEYLKTRSTTMFGKACLQLNEKLSEQVFLNDPSGYFSPAIFLLSDGAPTDDYKESLGRLKENRWFRSAIKVAIAIGKDANTRILSDFTGNPDTVVSVHNPESLKKWVKFVSVRASVLGSQNSTTPDENINASNRTDDLGNEIINASPDLNDNFIEW